jgi:hypothetical protein
MEMYLAEDFTGAASKTDYGKKGDKVKMIKVEGGIALADNGRELFHIRIEKLIEHKPVSDPTPIIHDNIKPPGARKRTSGPAAKPKTLF